MRRPPCCVFALRPVDNRILFFLRGTGLRHFALGSLLGPGNFVCYIESVINL